MRPIQLWWQHARVPIAVFAIAAGAFATSHADIAIAQALFFDASHMRWLGAGNWWINEFFHTGGRWLIRGVVAAAAALWIATCLDRELRVLQRAALYFVSAVVLSVSIVGLLKNVTNIDCPWDLVPFGGDFPVVPLFADRPDGLRYGRCFPAAHASTGYALLALYFVLRERSSAWARRGLGLGLLAGLVFGVAQQSRGAHFVSHDLWSAFIVWMTALTVYAFVFKARLWSPVRQSQLGSLEHEAALTADRLVAHGSVGVPAGTGGFPRPARERSAR